MIFIYRKAGSTSARELSAALKGRRVQRPRTIARFARPADALVCWGDAIDAPMTKQLNNVPPLNKFTELTRLKESGVPTVNFARVPAEGWLGRTINHTGGLDLLKPPARPDYFVAKEEFVKEVRVHSFNGRSIRAGVKVPREGYAAVTKDAQPLAEGVQVLHPWVRSWDGGWRLSYSGKGVKQKHRDAAHAAVKALGLSFGAVDIGERKDGSLAVLEVNRAPGVEGGTIEAYARAITAWLEGKEPPPKQAEGGNG